MSGIEKIRKEFYKKPIPNDISYADMKKMAKYYGCIVDNNGGKHSLRVVYKPFGIVIPIPVHGKSVD